MKIGILGSRGIPNHYGGFEQFAQYLSSGLAERGAEVWVYCSSSHPYQEKKWGKVKLIHCNDPEDKMGTPGQFIYDLNCIRDSRKRDFDILYQLGYTSNSAWYKLLPKHATVVTNMDGLEWKRNKYSKRVQKFLKYAERLAVKSSQVLIADSEAIQKYLEDTYQRSATFIPYGAEIFSQSDPSFLEQFNVETYGYYLLMARMQSDNHIEEIIKGILDTKTQFPLLIIGQTNNKFGKYLQEKYKNDRIRFLGGIFDANLLNQLRYFSAFYFHGHSAGGTNPSLLEAMASSAYIFAHDNPFNREVLRENALYFDNPQHIAETINSTDIITSVRKIAINNNLIAIKEKYNWIKIVDDYYRLFQSLL